MYLSIQPQPQITVEHFNYPLPIDGNAITEKAFNRLLQLYITIFKDFVRCSEKSPCITVLPAVVTGCVGGQFSFNMSLPIGFCSAVVPNILLQPPPGGLSTLQ